MTPRRFKRGVLAAALALLVASGPLGAAPTAAVSIDDYKFKPERLTVKAGATVKWTNNEKRTSHSVWFKNAGEPESERFFPGESWQRTFDKPGTYPYTCGPHPEMKGVIEVVP